MKCKLIIGLAMVALAGSVSADAIVVAGWDSWNTGTQDQAANFLAADITASVFMSTNITGAINGDWVRKAGGSNDETFGAFAGARVNTGAGSRGALFAQGTGVYLDYTITNGGVTDYELGGFRFDAYRKSGDALDPSVEILAGGGITAGLLWSDGASLSSFSSVVPDDTLGADYSDVDISLTGLADYTLGAGESVTFRILMNTHGASGTSGTYIDNVALTTVPEPATMSLIVISTISLLIFRRARR